MTRVFEALAAYTYAHQLHSGGNRLRTQMLAAVLAHRNVVPVDEALYLAMNDAFDPRVREASAEVDRLLDQARRAAVAAEMGEEVPA